MSQRRHPGPSPDRPRRGGLGQPTARWRDDLRPDGEAGTEVWQPFTHGPGFSFLRRAIAKYPDREAEFVADRAAELASNIRATVRAAALFSS